MAKSFDVSLILRVLDKATSPLQKIGRSIGALVRPLRMTEAGFERVSKAVERTSRKMVDIGRKMSMRVTLPIVAFGTAAFKASMDFNRAMANVGVIIPKQINKLEDLKQTVLSMSKALGTQPTGLAQALYQVISALELTPATKDILGISAKVAKGGLATVEESINLITNVMLAYGESTAEAATRTGELALATVRLGKTTLPELAAEIGGAAPWAAQLGISQEEMFAGFGALAGITGSTSEIATQLAAVMRGLVKQTPLMKKATKALGYKSGIDMVKVLGLQKTLTVLWELIKKDETVLTDLFGRAQALGAVLAITGKQSERYTRITKDLLHTAGEINSSFKIQTEGINRAGHAWDLLKAKLTVFSIRIGDILGVVLTPVLKWLDEMITKLDNFDIGTKKIIMVLFGLAAALPILIMLFGNLGLAILGISTLGAPFIAACAAIALAIAGVSLGVYQLIKHWDELKKMFLENPFSFIVDFLSIMTAGIIPKFEVWKKLWEDIYEIVKSVFDKLSSIGKFVFPAFTTPEKMSEGFGPGFGSSDIIGKSETEVTIRVTSDPGTSATVEGVKKRGNPKVNIATEGYVGPMGGIYP